MFSCNQRDLQQYQDVVQNFDSNVSNSQQHSNQYEPIPSSHSCFDQTSLNNQHQLVIQNEQVNQGSSEARRTSTRILDGQYQLLNTIGNGRFAKQIFISNLFFFRVKKALDIQNNKYVAVKLLKTNQTSLSRKAMLESFYQEIKILSYCRHPNIVRIIDASFDGTMIIESTIQKERANSDFNSNKLIDQSQDQVQNQSLLTNALNHGEQNYKNQQFSDKEDEHENEVLVRRKNKICYCVLKLVNTHLSKALFRQLIQGLDYLHSMGVVHRDIKPENLLIDPKGKLVIGDFGFAKDTLDYNRKPEFEIEKPSCVGSEEYNAPELFEQENTLKQSTYNSAQADIFSAGVTLFLMMTQSPPFRKAQIMDPYFRRLSASDKKAFWKIFSSLDINDQFKDLFERMTERDPGLRATLEDIKKHSWLQEYNENKDVNKNEEEILRQDLEERYQIVEKIRESLINEEYARRMMSSLTLSDEEEAEAYQDDQEQRQKIIDQQEFEYLRLKLIESIDELRPRMKRQRSL